ncbi:hypothetical protein PPTG_04121 [Phytophthora nicotianae INRA-310]|uniref:Tc1-like transposase DDE domain-containing protein n=1 Tax=Phytophthora nicotianae (strain INRA-310) TaxID=761204 RepID=W2QZK4_PHYN3|nr:hypothetical protein PPTG_04121 [Phytophthora nicotianae INRA-310]ETN18543.1 hypothetical protein PPTG_04121 [Phytophthora nicotianae INRA-310]
MVESKRSSTSRPAGSKTVTVQQDNATPHTSAYSEAVKQACYSDGWKINFLNQPPRRPDLLDLGFYSSIQALQYQKRAYGVEQLVATVMSACSELQSVTLSKCFLTLRSVLEQAMLNQGGKRVQDPASEQGQVAPLGDLPLLLPCSSETVEIANAALDEVIV